MENHLPLFEISGTFSNLIFYFFTRQQRPDRTFSRKTSKNVAKKENKPYICIRNCRLAIADSGCSSARLEYTSGGRVVVRSNRITPTARKP